MTDASFDATRLCRIPRSFLAGSFEAILSPRHPVTSSPSHNCVLEDVYKVAERCHSCPRGRRGHFPLPLASKTTRLNLSTVKQRSFLSCVLSDLQTQIDAEECNRPPRRLHGMTWAWHGLAKMSVQFIISVSD